MDCVVLSNLLSESTPNDCFITYRKSFRSTTIVFHIALLFLNITTLPNQIEANTMPDLLDAQTIELLSSMDSFFIQQRVRMIEAVTQGCWEQPNVYDVFDHETNKRVMVSCVQKKTLGVCSRGFVGARASKQADQNAGHFRYHNMTSHK